MTVTAYARRPLNMIHYKFIYLYIAYKENINLKSLLLKKYKNIKRIYSPVFDKKLNEWRVLSNKELDQKGKEPNIVEVIKINRLRWLGHVSRMADNRLPKKMLIWEGPHNKRPRGRPRIRWKDEVYKDARRLDKDWKEVIRDRDGWRRLLRTARNH